MTKTEDLLNVLKNSRTPQLPGSASMQFTDYLQQLADERHLKRSEIIERAQLQRTYGYQIFSGHRTPGKDKIVQLALAMQLDLEQTDRLLKLAQAGSLYPRIARDSVLIWALMHHQSVLKTNLLLDEKGFDPL